MYRCLLMTAICDDVIIIDEYVNKAATQTKIVNKNMEKFGFVLKNSSVLPSLKKKYKLKPIK